MEKAKNVPNVIKSLETIASEICDNYCKYPAGYFIGIDTDLDVQTMVDEKCSQCPLAQFLDC